MVRDAFALRYYRWARAEAEREIAGGFPFLRRVEGALAQRYLAHLSVLDGAAQEETLVALVKRFHPLGSGLAGEPVSAREREILTLMRTVVATPLAEEVVSGVEDLRQRKKNRPDARRLRRVAASKLPEHCGRPDGSLPGVGGGFYVSPMGRWQVRTAVGFTAAPLYFHQIVGIGEPPFLLQDGISLMSWLGLSGQTTWDRLERGGEDGAVETMSDLCRHFMGAAPELLAGL